MRMESQTDWGIQRFRCNMRGMKLVSILFLYVYHVIPVMGVRSGPFKISYISVAPCANLTQPIDKDPASTFFAELYNTTTDSHLLRGNVTVLRDQRMKKMSAKTYMWDHNKWKVIYLINNMGCNRIFFPALAKGTGVKYDPKTCTFYKGVYTFNNFNINKVMHTFSNIQEYGKMLWKMEVFSQTGSVFCYDFQSLVEPEIQ